jgi:Zn finger protein HypA/HybF involved in hydrogenase expression
MLVKEKKDCIEIKKKVLYRLEQDSSFTKKELLQAYGYYDCLEYNLNLEKDRITCPKCKGDREIELPIPTSPEEAVYYTEENNDYREFRIIECPKCKGKGYILK